MINEDFLFTIIKNEEKKGNESLKLTIIAKVHFDKLIAYARLARARKI